MMRIGLTGGIGSGKSTVAGMFAELGVPIYNSDTAARRLMEEKPALRAEITALLGPRSYQGGSLNRTYIASRVFSDPELLQALNALVHPAVASDFNAWSQVQRAPYVLQEAAILFENGGYRKLDRMILVTAPEKERVRRVASRDETTAAEIRKRMQHQWPEQEKIPLADYVIPNVDLDQTRKTVTRIHRELLDLSGPADPA
ncbi:dephospho-CoA kinase [Robiginitalea sp. SC105]|uniref:dephospho-CoA kinase n=1 Tax=Robiginitalea sp. SC105 TaxID=2762332 RepID=UPI00163A9444|nr:dephospho-CoA kinase [Robiginitalea sp. SC105]MBC2840761.1 dephospho-CoA kinase [Robiginitalea sp. SC105]